jgi:hypothetical protein
VFDVSQAVSIPRLVYCLFYLCLDEVLRLGVRDCGYLLVVGIGDAGVLNGFFMFLFWSYGNVIAKIVWQHPSLHVSRLKLARNWNLTL